MSLHFLVEQGDIAAVSKQLAKGADINESSQYSGRTPLICALDLVATKASVGLELVALLIERGADANQIAEEKYGQYGQKFAQLPLLAAVRSHNVAALRLLLDAGAKVRPENTRFRCVLMDAMTAYDDDFCEGGDNLSEILSLLIEQGADVDAAYPHGPGGSAESAVMRASSEGLFELVQLLVDAGADTSRLGWSELMWAVVFGSVEQVKTLVAAGAELTATDHVYRTPWLLSVAVGELEKAKWLRLVEAKRSGVGYYGAMPVECAIQNDRVAVLRWLIEIGFDMGSPNDYELTPVMQAAADGAVECLRWLIEQGADIFATKKHGGCAMNLARRKDVIWLLAAAGESLDRIEEEMLPLVTGVRQQEIGISQKQFLSGRSRQFGRGNPAEMSMAFWRDMVATGYGAYRVVSQLGGKMENDVGSRLKSEPVWCYQRFGRSLTILPDGRVIAIAGEHEDFYDPDFCIYNDVVVYDGKGDFEIFGYPEEIFPPTDFHSATLVGHYIYIIGSLGYTNYRREGETPVYRLNCKNLAISEVKTTGDNPGWISRHRAQYDDLHDDGLGSDGFGEITISGGKVFGQRDGQKNGKSDYYDNQKTYCLNLSTLVWNCVEESF